MTTFSIGDVVRLKSGGPEMTVYDLLEKALTPYWVTCRWFDFRHKPDVGDFAPVELDLIRPATPPEPVPAPEPIRMTPGEWRIDPRDDGCRIVGDRNRTVCASIRYLSDDSHFYWPANRAAIVQIPRMVEFIKDSANPNMQWIEAGNNMILSGKDAMVKRAQSILDDIKKAEAE